MTVLETVLQHCIAYGSHVIVDGRVYATGVVLRFDRLGSAVVIRESVNGSHETLVPLASIEQVRHLVNNRTLFERARAGAA